MIKTRLSLSYAQLCVSEHRLPHMEKPKYGELIMTCAAQKGGFCCFGQSLHGPSVLYAISDVRSNAGDAKGSKGSKDAATSNQEPTPNGAPYEVPLLCLQHYISTRRRFHKRLIRGRANI